MDSLEVSSSGGKRRKEERERPEQQLYETDEEKGWHIEYRDLLEGVEGQAVALIYALKAFHPEAIHHMLAANFTEYLYSPGCPLITAQGAVPG